ncbi:ATP-binding protein [Lentimicrobium sp. S6]|uniref:ATP-binding protein n=1 Tax=Lentimicrobium sp. S6 TaxID=2735872 RepID=UPI00155263E6|nr:AAA family ATPase [Lentimicrobium sp. S6]NPD47137.1 ATP-binding protein [Lentimicrobium sp. S6]
MKRELYKKLVKWKDSKNRKPLVLQGARQVGKTYLVDDFAKQEYKKYLYLNFEKDIELDSLFESSLDPKKLIDNISFYKGVKIEANSFLLFFDEIQASEKALKSLKYFQEYAPEYHIIAAGSLLGVAVGKDKSFPVGKVTFLSMYPMSFSEYLRAFGEEVLCDKLESLVKVEQFPEPIHNKLIKHLKQYLFLGGMPEVLQNFLDHSDITASRKIQNDILKSYENDFSKYTNKSQVIKNLEIWNSIPYQLAKENKKFKYSDLKNKARAAQYEHSIEWLRQAGLINISYLIKTPKLPLAGYTDQSKFKIFLLDTGLLGAKLQITSDTIVNPSALFKEYNGAFIENFVAMELQGHTEGKLFYWTSRGEAEVDFIIQNKKEIYPVEVKSGTSKTLKSLRSYSQKYNPGLIFRASPQNFYQREEFVNLPLYTISSVYNYLNGTKTEKE